MFERAAITGALLLGASALALAQPEEPERPDTIQVDEGDMSVGELIQRWARVTGRLPILDPQIEPIRVRFAESGVIDPPTLLRLLDFYDVVVTETGPLLNAHHRRNLAQKEGPPWRLVEDVAELKQLNEVVTHVIPIRHGAGQAIFATVRGLLTRDTNRIGNILYIQGPEVIVLVDLADKIAYYREVIQELDRPPTTRRVDVAVLELPRTSWKELREQQGPALAAALDDAVDGDRATLLDEASLTSVAGRFALRRELALGDGESVWLQLSTGLASQAIGNDKATHVAVAGADMLRVELKLQGSQQSLHRELELPIPHLDSGASNVVAVAGREGKTLVIAVQVR